MTSANGCTGTVRTSADGGHDEDADIVGVMGAEYTDNGGGGQAEHFGTGSGVSVIAKDTAHGGNTVGDINNGDRISFTPYVLSDAKSLTARVSSGGTGGTLEIRAGVRDRHPARQGDRPGDRRPETFQDATAGLSRAPRGTTTLYLVFKGSGTGALFDVDDFTCTTG
ncbi:carbohydrate-binding protein [Streptomyces canus]|uniref:carbohydrate-binding protein n=1 Tax=Streptomyces canus TaxID=58343 RepID=UPI00225461A8|nr:carbohydrate-binding protein [Streptomyces canus]MCX5253235.1 carbohydrate-binding protein [Streptomyces canus]